MSSLSLAAKDIKDRSIVFARKLELHSLNVELAALKLVQILELVDRGEFLSAENKREWDLCVKVVQAAGIDVSPAGAALMAELSERSKKQKRK